MTNFFDGAIRTLTGMGPPPNRNTWHKSKNGVKVPGDHKATAEDEDTPKPETIAQIGGKIRQSLANFRAKTQRWPYDKDLDRYIGELHALGGTLTAKQKLDLKALSAVDERAKAIAVKYGYDTNLYSAAEPGSQIPSPPRDRSPLRRPPSPVEARRPPDTPSREEPPEKVPRRLEYNNGLPAPTPPTQVEAPISNETVPSAEAPEPIAVDPPQEMSAATAPSGGSDPSGGASAGDIEFMSYPMETEMRDGCIYVRCGGSRLMYTWAYQMFPHNLDGTTNSATPFGNGLIDYYPVAHRVPWEWLPFYITPAEYDSLLWNKADIEIQHVRCRVTPMGKETQFSTSSTSTDPVSNEHVTFGKYCVGFNHKFPGITAMRNWSGNVSGNTMKLSKSEQINWVKLRQKIWGDLSDWTSGQMVASKQSCIDLVARELETLDGVCMDFFDKTTKNSNSRNFGSPRFDLYFKRFGFMGKIGKPIIDEMYVPKCGVLSQVPFRRLNLDQGLDQFLLQGNHCFQKSYTQPTVKNRQSTYTGTWNDGSENMNIGNENYVGAYHRMIETRQTDSPGAGFEGRDGFSSQPSISIGICPIMPIDPTTEQPTPIQARALWKIDYEIVIKQKLHSGFPYATYCTPSASTGYERFPPNCRLGTLPPKMLYPVSFDGTNTAYPNRELLNNYTDQVSNCGRALYNNSAANDTDTTMCGWNYTTPGLQSKSGLQPT